ncbi:DUF4401 domain-containing protein [Marinifilum flexuosum]|uniref:Uncharacterized protein DUF4401 n=1 Tax=Marinifilum flexuosum TaxID=1117708 RepID=A0A419WGQ2_9BACT|nr:DUF4401 domain-containing protein [Marinifilum flexuosum]RKD94526.1 uncharacterized protein DUF4401 [Marinifilum flexuosum]
MENDINIRKNIEYISKLEGNRFKFNENKIEKEYADSQKEKSSIAIKILSIIGGFLATLAFLGFLLIAGLYDSEAGLVITGSLFTGIAIWLNVEYKKLIIDTLSVSAYAIGLFLIVFGLTALDIGGITICILLILIALLTIGITKSYILSFISVLTINGCFIYLIFDNDVYGLIHVYDAILLVLLTYVFLNEAKLLADKRFPSKLYNPIRIGLMISLITGLVFVGQRGIFDFGIKHIWASSIITIPLTIYLISIIVKIIGITNTKLLYLIYTLSILFLIPTALSPAISGALLIILLSFLVNYKTGLVIGIISFIYFISQYYYDLNYTLLTKSIILFVSGIIFLLFYLFTHKKLGQNEKV